jgi:hypothetical protein
MFVIARRARRGVPIRAKIGHRILNLLQLLPVPKIRLLFIKSARRVRKRLVRTMAGAHLRRPENDDDVERTDRMPAQRKACGRDAGAPT